MSIGETSKVNAVSVDLQDFRPNPFVEACRRAIKEASGEVTLTSFADPLGLSGRISTTTPARPFAVVADYIDPDLNLDDLVIVHNGRNIAPGEAQREAVRPGDMICVAPVPRGGGGDGKSVMRLVAFAVLAVVAAPVAGFLAPAGMGAAGLGLIQTGVMIGGGMLINSLMPPEVPTLEQQQFEDASATYSISGPKSTSGEGVAVPIVYGRHIVAPNRILIRTSNTGPSDVFNTWTQTQWLHMVFALAEGEIAGIEDVLVNDTSLETFQPEDYVIDWRPGVVDQALDSDFQFNSRTIQHGVELSQEWYYFTTSDDVTSLNIGVNFPAGLLRRTEQGKASAYTVNFEIEYRVAGEDGEWSALPTYTADTGGLGPDEPGDNSALRWASQYGVTDPFFSYEEFEDSILNGQMGMPGYPDYDPYPPGSVIYAGFRGDMVLMRNDKLVVPTAGEIARDMAKQGLEAKQFYYGWDGVSKNRDGKKRVSLVGVSFVPAGSSTPSATGAQNSAFFRNFQSLPIGLGTYEVRMRRTSATKMDTSPEKFQDRAVIQEVLEQLPQEIRYIHTALLGLAMRATKQLARVPNVTCVVAGRLVKIRYFDEATGQYDWTRGWSDNPAWIVYDILTGARINGRPVPESNIMIDGFQQLADYCEANGLKFNGVFDRVGRNRWDCAQDVLRVAHAQLIRMGDRFGVVFDRPDVPVMLFNSTNTLKGTMRTEWLPMDERANTVEITYFDAEDGYKRKITRVSVEDSDALGTAVQPVKLEVVGISNTEQAVKYAAYKLNQNLLLRHTVTFEAPMDALALTLGDLFYFQSDVADWNAGGRLVSGSTATRLQLDRPVTIEAGQPHQVLVHFDQVEVGRGQVLNSLGTYVVLDGYSGEHANILTVDGVEHRVVDTVELDGQPGVQLDSVVSFNAGDLYTLVSFDHIEVRDVTTPAGTVEALDLAEPLSGTPEPLTKFVVGPVDTAKRIYRVAEIRGEGADSREIKGIEYNERVFEYDGTVADVISGPPVLVLPVTDLTWSENPDAATQGAVARVRLEWKAEPGSSYMGALIYRADYDLEADNYGPYVLITELEAGEVAYEDEIPRNQNYAYSVVATGPDGLVSRTYEAPSIQVRLSGKSQPPLAPIDVLGIELEEAVRLEWALEESAQANFGRVEVLRASVDDSAFAIVVSKTTGDHFQEPLDAEQTRYYWLRTVDNQGVTGPLNSADGLRLTARRKVVDADDIQAPPGYTQAPPALLQATTGYREILIAWQNPGDAHFDATEVYAGPTSSFAGASKTFSGKSEQYKHASDSDAPVYFWARSVSRFGHVSPVIGPIEGKASLDLPSDDLAPPANYSQAPVTNLAAYPTVKGADLVWKNPAGRHFDRVAVYAGATNDFQAATEVASGKIDRFTAPLAASTKGFFWVRAYSAWDHESDLAGPVNTTSLAGWSSDDVPELRDTVAENAQELTDQAQAIADVTESVSTVEGTTQANAGALQGIDARLETAEGEITSQGTALTQVQAGLADVQGQSAANADAIQGISATVTENQDGIDALSTATTRLEAEALVADILVFRQPTEPTEEDLPPLPEGVPSYSMDFENETYLWYGIPPNSVWYNTAEGNKPYLYVDGAWTDTQDQQGVANATALEGLEARVTDTEEGQVAQANQLTQLGSEIVAVQETADGAQQTATAAATATSGLETRVEQTEQGLSSQATQVSTITSELDDTKATVSQMSTVVDGVAAAYVLEVDANGRIVGMRLASDENGTSIQFVTDNFSIVSSDPGAEPITPFLIDGNLVRIPKLSVGTLNIEDGAVDLSGPKVKGKIAGANIEDGAIVNMTESQASPNTPVFNGSDDGAWKTVASLEVEVLGDGSAIALQFNFSLSVDQVQATGQQFGAGGPDVELRLMRGQNTVWNPDPIMVSGAGRATLQFGAKIDSGMAAGTHVYDVQIRWVKGRYEAGTADFNVYYSTSTGDAMLAGSDYAGGSRYGDFTFNGAYLSTYTNASWRLVVPSAFDDARTFLGAAQDPQSGQLVYIVNDENATPNLPANPGQAGQTVRLYNQPYYCFNPDHSMIASLANYWIRAVEYRG